jgi:hypothetical protein
MGAVSPSKMPKAKTITRKDDPNEVTMYAKGGKVKKFGRGGDSVKDDFDKINKANERKPPVPAPKPKPDNTPLPPTGEYKGGDDLVTKNKAKGGKVNWIKGAIKKPGALRASLGAKKGEPIPAKKLAKAAKAPGKLGQRARFAQVLKGFKKKK